MIQISEVDDFIQKRDVSDLSQYSCYRYSALKYLVFLRSELETQRKYTEKLERLNDKLMGFDETDEVVLDEELSL